MVIDDNGDREPEYWLWGLGPGMNESQVYGLVPVKQDPQDEVRPTCIDAIIAAPTFDKKIIIILSGASYVLLHPHTV